MVAAWKKEMKEGQKIPLQAPDPVWIWARSIFPILQIGILCKITLNKGFYSSKINGEGGLNTIWKIKIKALDFDYKNMKSHYLFNLKFSEKVIYLFTIQKLKSERPLSAKFPLHQSLPNY